MSRKVFISFLGTNNYVECNYFLESNSATKVESVKYIQEALIPLFCQDYTENDIFLFCLTDEARKKNWGDDGHTDFRNNNAPLPNIGLENRLKRLGLRSACQDVTIEEGLTSEDVWKIFHTLCDLFQEGDEVSLDITHGFRSLPMLGLSLIDYLKTVKNIKVKHICYGAFEKLGYADAVKRMPISERNAAILDLTNFSLLQDWTKTADTFVKYGNTQAMSSLATQQLKPLVSAAKGTDHVLKHFGKFTKNLQLFNDILQTNRGKAIIEGKIFKDLMENLAEIEHSDYIAPMKPLFHKIRQKISRFQEDSIANGFVAVEWCIEHQQVQQGITILQENILSYLCHKFAEKYNLEYKKLRNRDLIKSCLVIVSLKLETNQSKWKNIEEGDYKLVEKIIREPLIKNFEKEYQSLSQFRNDINHAGFLENARDAATFSRQLKQSYDKIKNLIHS
jgi:CRISPR-associated DxTHG motif protein